MNLPITWIEYWRKAGTRSSAAALLASRFSLLVARCSLLVARCSLKDFSSLKSINRVNFYLLH
ncbi:hypothetical protein FOF44_06315 [Vibrio algivorus]|uniref:Uncharacterized protein n=1 Tax=Vibrio algivorus TaxID=1667024 RepID=A0A557PA87_9VIBR|nr:hypothetical protein FOF44_06315 [Vibrio algivorus]